MKASTPVRIDADLYRSATSAASVMSRSAAQQIAHWARIGRELEASPGVSVDDIAQVLRGAKDYDALGTQEQSVVRAYWAEKMAALMATLRLDEKFVAEGRPYVELDESGATCRSSTPISSPNDSGPTTRSPTLTRPRSRRPSSARRRSKSDGRSWPRRSSLIPPSWISCTLREPRGTDGISM